MNDPAKMICKISLPTGFPVGDVNVYILRDDPITLIDTGVNGAISEHILDVSLKHIGLEFRDIKRIVVTHTHLDHCGMAGRMQELSGSPILVFGSKIEEIKNYNESFLKRPRALRSFYLESAVPEGVFSRSLRNYQKSIYLGCAVDRPTALVEGSLIEGANYKLEVIHTPGHSDDTICLLEREKKVLFSSDHVTTKMPPSLILGEVFAAKNGELGNLSDYLSSLEKIENLEIMHTLPGHGESFLTPNPIISKIRETCLTRKEFLAKILKKGIKNRFELTRALFGSLHEREIFKGIPEVAGHLSLLEKEGRLTKWNENGIMYYSIKN